MGFMDKLKSVANAVTGNAAKVSIEVQPAVAFAGDTVTVKITATSTGQEVKSKGVFVDIRGLEEIRIGKNTVSTDKDIQVTKSTYDQSFQIAQALVLPPNETKFFEGSFQIPASLQPTFQGTYTQHRWEIRGRLEATGNDPDSGWQPIRVGIKS